MLGIGRVPLGSIPGTAKKKKNPQKINQEWWHMPVIPVLGRLKQEDHRFKANLSNLVRHCFKIKNKLGMVARACNPSTWEAETGGSQV